MAKRRARRRRTKILKGIVDENMSLGTLANTTLIAAAFDESVNERSFLISMEATWHMQDISTSGGPVTVGVAHADYSAAEIEQWIENTGSWNEGNLVQQEISMRKIRQVGVFAMNDSDESLNDGLLIKTPLRWIVNQGQGLSLWAYNDSGAALTTGNVVTVDGWCWIRPT